uniref:Uncharacterized protein n=1 Tax=Lygus hesperus TaxID=30085 RepID=A0A0A9X366_LYGHE
MTQYSQLCYTVLEILLRIHALLQLDSEALATVRLFEHFSISHPTPFSSFVEEAATCFHRHFQAYNLSNGAEACKLLQLMYAIREYISAGVFDEKALLQLLQYASVFFGVQISLCTLAVGTVAPVLHFQHHRSSLECATLSSQFPNAAAASLCTHSMCFSHPTHSHTVQISPVNHVDDLPCVDGCTLTALDP